MSNFNSINNSGVPYYFPADTAKEGNQYVRISNFFKTRVGDNGKVLPFKWYDQGRVMNVHGFIPFIKGLIGKFSTDDNDEVIMAPDASYREWQGSTANAHDGGFIDYVLEDQMFPQEGIFKGHFGLKDGNGNVLTSVNIIFEVLGNDLRVGETVKYYVGELEDLKNQYRIKAEQAVKDINQRNIDETQNTRAALQAAQAQIQANRDEQANISTHLAGIQQQIATHDIVTIPQFNQLSNQLTQQVSEMRQSGLQFFNSENDLKNTYPTGANKLCVTLDTSHQWVYDYVNNAWNDAGTFNFGTIDPKLKKSIYLSNPSNLILNSDFNSMDLWNAARDGGVEPNCYINANTKNNSNSLVISGFIKDGTTNESWVKTDQIPVSGHTTLSIGASLKIQGINSRVGDTAGIDITWIDQNNNNFYYSHYYVVPANDGEFQNYMWENIQIPPAAVNFQIAFNIYGEGIIEVLQPHANFGANLLNYNGELNKFDLDNWQPTTNGSSYFSRGSDNIIGIIGDNNIHDYAYLSSPIIWTGDQKYFDALVRGKANWPYGSGEAYLEVIEFNADEAPLVAKGYQPSTKQDFKLWPSNDTYDYRFKGINLNPLTVAVVLRVVIHGNATVDISSIDFKSNSSNPVVTNILTNNNDDIEDVLTIADGLYHVNTLSNNTNKYHFSRSNLIPKKWNKVDLSVNAQVSLKNVESLALSSVYLEIDQYIDQNTQNTSMQIKKELKPTDSISNFSFKDIKLDPSTNFITIGITAYNNVDIYFSDISLNPSSQNSDDLTPSISLTGFDINPPAEYNSQTGIATLPQAAKPDQWIMADTECFRVIPGSIISLKAFARAEVENQTNAVIEINQHKTLTDPIDPSLNIDLHLDQEKQLTEYRLENLKLDPTTNFISLRLAFPGNGSIEVKTIEIWNLDHIPGLSSSKYISSLPHLNIQSNADITDKWRSAKFNYQDGERNLSGYLQFAIQGDSSRNHPKKNLKVKFFEDSECKQKLKWKPKSTWVANYKFNIKANYIDATQARNLVNAKIFSQATAITPLLHKGQTDLLKAQALGQMEGFPIELFFNGSYYGLMTFNIKKDDKNFGMDADKPEDEVISSTNEAYPWFYNSAAPIDGKVFATEIHDSASNELKTNFKKFLEFLNTSDDDNFKKQLSNYIDLYSVINTYLFGLLAKMEDSWGKSGMLLTWNNGQSFYETLYDLDSTWGLSWNGLSSDDPDWSLDPGNPGKHVTGISYNKLHERLFKLFKPEIKAQWLKLRSSVWTNDKMLASFKEFINSIPEEAYEKDQKKWPDIPSAKTTDYGQIQESIIERGNEMDEFMEGL